MKSEAALRAGILEPQGLRRAGACLAEPLGTG
jgi:hypothetical protein